MIRVFRGSSGSAFVVVTRSASAKACFFEFSFLVSDTVVWASQVWVYRIASTIHVLAVTARRAQAVVP
jgi:hypothetical protein